MRGVDFDQVVISHDIEVDASFEGLLSISVTNGFTPALCDRFEIMKYFGSRNCTVILCNFLRLNGTELGGGLMLLPEYSSTNLVLAVTNIPAIRFYVAENGSDPLLRPRIRFHGSPATNYVLQGSTALTNWIDLFSNNEPIDLIDYVNDREDYWRYVGYRFYRVRWGE